MPWGSVNPNPRPTPWAEMPAWARQTSRTFGNPGNNSGGDNQMWGQPTQIGGFYPQQGGNVWGGMLGYMNNAMGSAMSQMADANSANATRSMLNRQYGGGGGGGGGSRGGGGGGGATGYEWNPMQGYYSIMPSYYGAQAGMQNTLVNNQGQNYRAGLDSHAGLAEAYINAQQKQNAMAMLVGLLGGGGFGGGSPSGYTTNYGAGVFPQKPGATGGQSTQGTTAPPNRFAGQAGGFAGGMGGFNPMSMYPTQPGYINPMFSPLGWGMPEMAGGGMGGGATGQAGAWGGPTGWSGSYGQPRDIYAQFNQNRQHGINRQAPKPPMLFPGLA